MMQIQSKLIKLERTIEKREIANQRISQCIPISPDPNYVPHYNDKGELIPPSLLGGLRNYPPNE